MKKKFWKVQIENYKDGTVKAAVLGNREALSKPLDIYKKLQIMEAIILWFETEAEAQGAVFGALENNAGVAA